MPKSNPIYPPAQSSSFQGNIHRSNSIPSTPLQREENAKQLKCTTLSKIVSACTRRTLYLLAHKPCFYACVNATGLTSVLQTFHSLPAFATQTGITPHTPALARPAKRFLGADQPSNVARSKAYLLQQRRHGRGWWQCSGSPSRQGALRGCRRRNAAC